MISTYLPVYRRSQISIVRGEGVFLFDEQGKRYLDFAAGIGVNSLGHCHPAAVAALKEQADVLWHCSNLYRMPGLEALSKLMVDNSFADTVFFCSTGAEAVETGLKMMRKYQRSKGGNKYRIITFEGGFHGRSLACISAGGNQVARDGFGPLLEGFDQIAFGDLRAVEAAITDETAGILIEPVQGEGGVRPADAAFLKGLRALCDANDLVLFFDEVQCGMGRVGTFCAYESYGVEPDMMAVAKGIGTGFPLGACLTKEVIAAAMTPGSHGSTYGSNPLAMAVGKAVVEALLAPGFLEAVKQRGQELRAGLEKLAAKHPDVVEELRGIGLMQGIRLKSEHDAYAMAETLRHAGLMTAPAQQNVLRLLPPLIVERQQISQALDLLDQTWDVARHAN